MLSVLSLVDTSPGVSGQKGLQVFEWNPDSMSFPSIPTYTWDMGLDSIWEAAQIFVDELDGDPNQEIIVSIMNGPWGELGTGGSSQLIIFELDTVVNDSAIFNIEYEDNAWTNWSGYNISVGDLDNDGDIDLVITNNNGKARVYENISQPMKWIGIIPSRSKRPVDSTQVRLIDSSPSCRKKTFHSDGSYASSSDPRIVFGLGKDNQKQTIEIHWPDGSTSEHPELRTNQYHYIRQPMTKQSQKLESE